VEGLLDWGVDVVLWFQQASPALDIPFKILTLMGNELFYLVFFPLLYWCLDRRVGARLIILFLFSSFINALAKELAGQPRPFQYDPAVQKLWDAGGGGLPSGHTQSAVVLWGYLASQWRRAWLWWVAGALIVLIPLSRVYLGVHFPTDLIGGYLLGAALLLLYLRFEPVTEAWLAGRTMGIQLLAAIVLPSLLLLLSPRVEGYQIRTVASLMGMGAGFVLERRWVRFDAGGSAWKKALRFLAGLVLLFVLREGLGALASGMGHESAFRFLRYLFLGLAGALIAPWIFVSVGLAQREEKTVSRSRYSRKGPARSGRPRSAG
jgi:membrane-associated phospholipid phosphatase